MTIPPAFNEQIFTRARHSQSLAIAHPNGDGEPPPPPKKKIVIVKL